MSETVFLSVLSGAVVLAYGLGMWLWWRSVVRRRERYRQQEVAFVPILLGAARNGAALALADVIDLYRAHFEEDNPGAIHSHLSKLLRRAELAIAAQGIHVVAADLKEALPLLRKFLSENEVLVREEEVRIPFSGTPSPERQLLQDVLELTAGDRDIVRSKLTEIAHAVTVRQDTIQRLGEEGRQSLRWAKLGLVGTVVFSMISIALGIWTLLR
jgi:hypothetical protein